MTNGKVYKLKFEEGGPWYCRLVSGAQCEAVSELMDDDKRPDFILKWLPLTLCDATGNRVYDEDGLRELPLRWLKPLSEETLDYNLLGAELPN